MGLENIIKVTIDRQTSNPTRAGFGTPLVAAYLPRINFVDRVMSYSSLGEMVDAGFKTTDPAYLAAGACFAQNPSPGVVKIGRRDNAPLQIIDVVPDPPVVGDVYTVTVVGYANSSFASRARPAAVDEASIIIIAQTDAEDVVDSLLPFFTAPGADFSAAKSGTGVNAKLVITADNTTMDGMIFGVTATSNCAINNVTLDPGIEADLTAINTYDSDWYGLVLDSYGRDEIYDEVANTGAAKWAEANKKLFVCQTSDKAVAGTSVASDTTSIAANLALSEFDRTMTFFHRNNYDYVGAAMLGRALPTTPGSITWAYKTLPGVTAQSLTTTQLGNLMGTLDTPGGKYVNAYITQNGIGHTRFGTMASGEYADVIHGVDWLEARIQEDVFAALVQEDKLPLTDAGINVIKGIILGRLWEGVSNGFLSPDPEPNCTVPRASDLSVADRAARKLTGVTFRATLAGAIHYTVIEGQLSV